MNSREEVICFTDKTEKEDIIEFICGCIEAYKIYIEEKNKLENGRENIKSK